MIDYYYKFLDEVQMIDVLTANDMTYTDNEGIHALQGNSQYAAWVVGELNGYEGYHYNLRLIDLTFDVTSLEPYLVHPQNPKVIWA
jgi:hypothetical protein